jgi:hypothetical protein
MNPHTDIELTPYREFRPTGFDTAGLGCEDQQDWLVAPCGQNRDSEALERSNYTEQAAALVAVDPDCVDHEDHRFGHWGPGWFELVLVRPGSACERVAKELKARLEDYPALNDDALSELEHDEQCDYVTNKAYRYGCPNERTGDVWRSLWGNNEFDNWPDTAPDSDTIRDACLAVLYPAVPFNEIELAGEVDFDEPAWLIRFDTYRPDCYDSTYFVTAATEAEARQTAREAFGDLNGAFEFVAFVPRSEQTP